VSAVARLEVWSDYLCPWCYNAAHRLERLREEFGPRLRVTWRSFLLRPHPRDGAPGFPGPDDPPRRVTPAARERFRAYTESWRRPAAEPDAAPLRPWQGQALPPSHSVPPHVAARAAASLGEEAFDALHRRLLAAYFHEHRDVTDRATLRSLWTEAGLPDEEFGRCDDPGHLAAVLRDHERAVAEGVTGVPAARMEGNDALVVGANPLELYRRWITRRLAGRI
jgi:predicted DsbA family dithiol-disulfide isomerase